MRETLANGQSFTDNEVILVINNNHTLCRSVPSLFPSNTFCWSWRLWIVNAGCQEQIQQAQQMAARVVRDWHMKLKIHSVDYEGRLNY